MDLLLSLTARWWLGIGVRDDVVKNQVVIDPLFKVIEIGGDKGSLLVIKVEETSVHSAVVWNSRLHSARTGSCSSVSCLPVELFH